MSWPQLIKHHLFLVIGQKPRLGESVFFFYAQKAAALVGAAGLVGVLAFTMGAFNKTVDEVYFRVISIYTLSGFGLYL